jgi:CxxC motif-containing protein
MAQTIICLGCPNGCHLECTRKADGAFEVEGAQCDRGEVYAREELTEPKRVVTAVVKTDSGDVPYIPVKTDKPLVRDRIPALLGLLYGQTVALPVRMGDTLLTDFDGTGVNVVFTRSAVSRM